MAETFAARIREHEEALALAARRALVRDARAAAARGGIAGADAVPARPRPDRPLEAVPPPEGQDAGLHRPGRRPLPHAHHAHARDVRDLARRRARAAAERGPRRGDRASATTPATRRSGTRARTRSTLLCKTRFGRRFRHNEQSLRIAEQLNLTEEVRDGILTHTGERRAGDARGQDRPHRRPRRVHQPRHRRRDPLRDPRRGRAAARRDRAARRDGLRADRHARARPRRVVGGAPATSVRATRSARRCSRSARSCSSASTSASTRAASTCARTASIAPHLRAPRRARRRAGRDRRRSSSGMTDRFALHYAETLD